MHATPLISARELTLAVDLYELTMLQAWWRAGFAPRAVFSLYFREMPPQRNFMLACGQHEILARLPELGFDADARERLAAVPALSKAFVASLADWKFTGDVHAVPEGTPVFAQEPLLEVEAPLPEAQLLETVLMNQVHAQSVLASRAVRMKLAAAGRPVVDFSMRRAHGIEAAVHGVRAFWIAGLDATSNVLGGLHHGVPLTGTMAHSYVQARDDESAAFAEFWRTQSEPTLLVDTWDTLAGVDTAIRLAREADSPLGAIRLDSGDLLALSRAARARLDAAGLASVRIIASGGLDEHSIAALVAANAPIDGYGVGTALGVARDAPALELVYKLTEIDGAPRGKLSAGKQMLPGRKQVYRERNGGGTVVADHLVHREESAPGTRLLEPVLRGGRRLPPLECTLDEARAHCAREVAALPAGLRGLEAAQSPLPVHVSKRLRDMQAELRRRHPGTVEP